MNQPRLTNSRQPRELLMSIRRHTYLINNSEREYGKAWREAAYEAGCILYYLHANTWSPRCDRPKRRKARRIAHQPA